MITYFVKPNSECETRPRRDFWIWDQARPRRDWIVKLFWDQDRDYWLIFKENETETEHGSDFHTRPRRDRESRILQSRDRDETETLANQCDTLLKKVTKNNEQRIRELSFNITSYLFITLLWLFWNILYLCYPDNPLTHKMTCSVFNFLLGFCY